MTQPKTQRVKQLLHPKRIHQKLQKKPPEIQSLSSSDQLIDLPKSFRSHVQEVKNRLLVCGVAIFAAVLAAYQFHQQIIILLIAPLHTTLFYNAPIGALSFTFTVVLCVGLFFASPVLLYEVFSFLAPVFPQLKRNNQFLLIVVTLILFLLGIAFGYEVSLPVTLHFFNQFSSSQLHSLITTDEYFSFMTEYLLAYGFVFEIPAIIFMVNLMFQIDYRQLRRKQRYVIVASFLMGAILTPDPLNQLILAGPIVVLYELSIAIVWIMNRRR